MSSKIRGRAILTAVTIFLWGVANWFMNVAAPILSSELAAKQFENSNTSYAISRTAQFFTGAGLPTFLLLVVLVAIWWKPLKGVFAATAVLVLIMAPHANAYYDKQDWPEVYFILPHESAFYIPDVGANKESQAKFGSEEYLKENKIPAKRFTITHVKLEGSGAFRDYYVPAGRLMVVERLPYNREWVASSDRGTSAKNQAFPCQSKEGLDITVGIAIGASLTEENSPKYLYHFGVKPPTGDRDKPEVIFTSVFHSRSLEEAMEGVVRNNIQGMVCEEFTTRSFDDGNAQASAIMVAVRTKVLAYMTSLGITLDFIGWADTFAFDPVVQKAINDRYGAEKIAPVLSVLERQADIKVKEGLGAGLAKKLPSTLLVPPDMMSAIMGMGGLRAMKAPEVTSSSPTK